MTRSPEEIEREVESARGNLDRTVDALKDKMSPGQLIDELTRGFKGGAGGEMFNNLGAQVRDNPMALAMIGAGMAWLMMGKSEGGVAATATSRPPEPPSFAPVSSHDASDGLGSAAGRFAEKVGDAASGLKDRVSDKAENALDGLQGLGEQATQTGQHAARSLEAMFQKEPLIVGALGLAVGVALGAALPATAIEDKTFGAARDEILKAGEERLASAGDTLRASGAAALDAVKEEADQQGLSPDTSDTPLVEKVEAVVRSGVDAARDELGRDRAV